MNFEELKDILNKSSVEKIYQQIGDKEQGPFKPEKIETVGVGKNAVIIFNNCGDLDYLEQIVLNMHFGGASNKFIISIENNSFLSAEKVNDNELLIKKKLGKQEVILRVFIL